MTLPLKRNADQPRLNGRYASNGPHGPRLIAIMPVTALAFQAIEHGETHFTTRLKRSWSTITTIRFTHRHYSTMRKVSSVERVGEDYFLILEPTK